MTTQEKSWGKLWGDINWKEVKPEEIDARLNQGACVNMIEKRIYPLGYDHTNPLIESMRANNPIAFTHLINKRKADLNFHLPFLLGPQVRQGNRSIVSDAPSLIYIQYAMHKGLEIRPKDFQDVIYRQDESKAMEKLAFLADYFEKKGNSEDSFQVLEYLPQVKDEEFAFQHFPLLLKNVDLKSPQKTSELLLSIAENKRINRLFKRKMLEMVTSQIRPSQTKRIVHSVASNMVSRGKKLERS